MPKEVDAIIKLYDLILWIIPKLEKYTGIRSFSLIDEKETFRQTYWGGTVRCRPLPD